MSNVFVVEGPRESPRLRTPAVTPCAMAGLREAPADG
jgi:hypothetical protein